MRGYFSEGLSWLEAVLAGVEAHSPELRSKTLSAAGNLAIDLRQYERARVRATCQPQGSQ